MGNSLLIKKVILRASVGTAKVKSKWILNYYLSDSDEPASPVIVKAIVFYLVPQTMASSIDTSQLLKSFKNYELRSRIIIFPEQVLNILSMNLPDQMETVRILKSEELAVIKFNLDQIT